MKRFLFSSGFTSILKRTRVCFILLALIYFSAQVEAQQRVLNWNESLQKDKIYISEDTFETFYYLGFSEAGYPDAETQLPYYYEQIETQPDETIISITLENQVWVPVSWNRLQKIRGLNTLAAEVTPTLKTEMDRGKRQYSVTFIPLRKNMTTGRVEQLERFEIITQREINPVAKLKSVASDLPSESILRKGPWRKMKVYADGIYKLSFENLTNAGISNPDKIQVYGNGGGQLPYNVSDDRPADLLELPLMKVFGNDGTFGPGDYILFYAEGPVKWNKSAGESIFRHHLHDYSTYSTYFITWGQAEAKQIPEAAKITNSSGLTIRSFIDYRFHEIENRNLINSGRLWVGKKFQGASDWDTTFVFSNIETSKEVHATGSFVARDNASSTFELSHNQTPVESVSIGLVNVDSYIYDYARIGNINTSFIPESDEVKLTVKFKPKTFDAEGWLDYIAVNAYRKLIFTGRFMKFTNIQQINPGAVHTYEIQNSGIDIDIWDISDIHDVQSMPLTQSGSTISFVSLGENIKKFVALNPSESFPVPEIEDENIPNQNLHATPPVDYVIVTYPTFMEQAEELADLHREKSGLKVQVVTAEQVYNEFSSGTPDASAIRDFMRFLYRKHGTDHPDAIKYLLLFGDGSYNNRSKSGTNSNFIVTYQSKNSLVQTASFVADDFFTFLDEGEGDNGGTMDIGVGRLPVSTVLEAQQAVNKIKQYMDADGMLPWRNKIAFIGDDEDGNIHMDQADQLTRKVDTLYPEFVLQKIYLDAYKQLTSASGATYPDVTTSINDAIQTGILIFNYTGHGGVRGLAHERILGKNDIQGWENAPYFPLFITATCEFSRFDDPDETTGGEQVLLNPNGGGIGLLTTTRLVYSRPNFILNLRFYDYAFDVDKDGNNLRFGDILRYSKNAVSGNNKRNFTLLGDPACQLNFPHFEVFTDSINAVAIESYEDTVSAFSQVTVSGYVAEKNGALFEDFNGTVYPSVFDKVQNLQTLNNDGDGAYTFKSRQNPLYKGKASVKDGRFKFTFLVPKDIAYNVGEGKIVYYAQDSVRDAHGYFDQMLIGGAPEVQLIDDAGPDIELYMNDVNFVSGGITSQKPIIFARISDESGINTSGAGIGHDLIGFLDDETRSPIILNEFFEAEKDNFRAGTLMYPLIDLSPGKHTLRIKAWDINNNSSEAEIAFFVRSGDEFVLEKVYNSPNPFSQTTRFVFEHNQAGKELEVSIDIYDLSGRVVRSISREMYSGGYRIENIEWNGTNNQGAKLGRGIYLYKIRLKSENGLVAEKIQRLMIL